MDQRALSRRDFVRATGGAATMAAAGGTTASAQQSISWPSYLDDAKGGSFKDLRGKKEVTVEVGGGSSGLAFLPTKIWIDPGTTVTFKWVSAGHNVVPKSQPEGSGWKGHDTLESSGFTYEHTFDTKGIFTYYCEPHEQSGMKGGIAVGDVGGGGGGKQGPPAWPSYAEGAKGGTTKDMRGKKEVTVEVGGGSSGLAFLPTKLWIDPGTTVIFKWVSSGHNVVPNSQPGSSSWKGHDTLESQGYTYEHTFDTGGMYSYYCAPHEGQGMKGAIAVGDDVPRQSTGGGGAEPVLPFEAKTLLIATMGSLVATLGLAYAFIKYGGNPPQKVEA